MCYDYHVSLCPAKDGCENIKKAGAAMPDSNREAKSTTRLSKLSAILPAVAGAMLLALLAFLCVTANFEVQQSRMDEGFSVVTSVVEGYKGRHLDLKKCEQIAKDLGAKFRVREWIKNGY